MSIPSKKNNHKINNRVYGKLMIMCITYVLTVLKPVYKWGGKYIGRYFKYGIHNKDHGF